MPGLVLEGVFGGKNKPLDGEKYKLGIIN